MHWKLRFKFCVDRVCSFRAVANVAPKIVFWEVFFTKTSFFITETPKCFFVYRMTYNGLAGSGGKDQNDEVNIPWLTVYILRMWEKLWTDWRQILCGRRSVRRNYVIENCWRSVNRFRLRVKFHPFSLTLIVTLIKLWACDYRVATVLLCVSHIRWCL